MRAFYCLKTIPATISFIQSSLDQLSDPGSHQAPESASAAGGNHHVPDRPLLPAYASDWLNLPMVITLQIT